MSAADTLAMPACGRILTIVEPKLPRCPESPLDISQLTLQMANGNEAAFKRCYELYFERLLRYLLVVTRDEDKARDALQATFIRVARYVKRFESEPVFWNWLTVLARSSAFDQGRASRRYLTFLGRFMKQKQIEAQCEPVEAHTDGLVLELLELKLAALPECERTLLEKKYCLKQSVRQIADELMVSEKTVESRLVRARRRLKDEMVAQLKHEL